MFDLLKKHKPLVKNINEIGGRLDPSFHFETVGQQPVKEVTNTRGNMDLLRMYSHGPLKWENTGATCENCVNFYYDRQAPLGGRCRQFNFKQVHPETPAMDTANFTHPATGETFPVWPACPEFIKKERLSRR